MGLHIVEGNLTKDPELRYTPTGQAITKIRLAYNTRVKTGDGWTDGPTQFFDLKTWGRLAEACAEQLHKGQHITATCGKPPVAEQWRTEAGGPRVTLVYTATGVAATVLPTKHTE